MPNQPVKFTRVSSTKFEEITKEENTVYFLTDTHQIFVGNQEYVPNNIATKQYVDDKVEESNTIDVDGTDYKLEFQVIDGSPCLITTEI